MASRADELRARADKLGRGRGRVIVADLRREMIEYARERTTADQSCQSIAAELGLSRMTLKRWLASPAFVHVQIQEPEPTRYAVTAPHGVRIEGLSLDDLAELLRRLS